MREIQLLNLNRAVLSGKDDFPAWESGITYLPEGYNTIQ